MPIHNYHCLCVKHIHVYKYKTRVIMYLVYMHVPFQGKDGGTYKPIPNYHTSMPDQQPKDMYSPRSQSYESPRSDSKALSISYVPVEAYEKLERKLGKQQEEIARKGAEISELRSRYEK